VGSEPNLSVWEMSRCIVVIVRRHTLATPSNHTSGTRLTLSPPLQLDRSLRKAGASHCCFDSCPLVAIASVRARLVERFVSPKEAYVVRVSAGVSAYPDMTFCIPLSRRNQASSVL